MLKVDSQKNDEIIGGLSNLVKLSEIDLTLNKGTSQLNDKHLTG